MSRAGTGGLHRWQTPQHLPGGQPKLLALALSLAQ